MTIKLKNNTNNFTIKENGFYNLSEIGESNLFIENGVDICIFDDTGSDVEIIVGENSKLNYFSFYEDSGNFSKNIISKSDNSDVNINTLFLSKNTKLISKVYGAIFANNCKMYMNLLSFAMENGDLEVDGIFEIGKSLESTKGFLNEDNIFLGDKAKIKALPKLFVESNDIEAGHACKMERISDNEIFYLRSRGIEKQNALSMIIDAKIVDLFSYLKFVDESFYDNLKDSVLTKIGS